MTTTAQEMIAAGAADGQLQDRIRDAAIAKIGKHGFRASLRDIAAAAGLSINAVLDVYGSKRKLLEACDDYVVQAIRGSKSEALQSHDPAVWLSALAGIESYAPLMAYLVRSMEESQGLGRNMVDRMIENAVGYLDEGVRAGTIKPCRDPGARAKFLVLTNAGGFLLYRRRHRTPNDIAAVLRDYSGEMVVPALEIYTHGLMTDAAMLDAVTGQAAGA